MLKSARFPKFFSKIWNSHSFNYCTYAPRVFSKNSEKKFYPLTKLIGFFSFKRSIRYYIVVIRTSLGYLIKSYKEFIIKILEYCRLSFSYKKISLSFVKFILSNSHIFSLLDFRNSYCISASSLRKGCSVTMLKI